MTKRVLNIPVRVLYRYIDSNDGRIILATWLGIKLAFGNSTLYDISTENLMKFYHLRRDRAKVIYRLMWENQDLFFVNEKKNCVFAKSCKNMTIKYNRFGNIYRGDDVITMDVPEQYLQPKEGKEFLELEKLIHLLLKAYVRKEYDDGKRYKSNGHATNGCSSICETDRSKSQKFIAAKANVSRYKIMRIVKELVKEGILSKTECHVEKCQANERFSFKARNKKTGLEYYAKCIPASFSVDQSSKGISCRFLIWDAPKRLLSRHLKSDKAYKKEVLSKAEVPLTNDELNFRAMALRELDKRALYD